MEKLTIIYYEILNYLPENIQLLNDNFNIVTLPNPSHDNSEILSLTDIILAPLGYYFGKEKIDLSRRLKAIGSNTTGHPHIDVEYATRKGIKVVTLKDQEDFLNTITPTAEFTWGLIITLTRNIIVAHNSVLEGKWERWPFGGQSMLSRMTLGVVGLGRLGKMVASYGVCFGMRVMYFDPYVDVSPKGIEKIDTLEALVENSDIVTLHVPHEKNTTNLFDEKIFYKFKKGSYFINTSRGELVNHHILLKLLKNKILAGAAIDVIEGEFEPDFTKSVIHQPLVRYASKHSNLIITPHIGGSTVDAWNLTQRFTIQKVIESLK